MTQTPLPKSLQTDTPRIEVWSEKHRIEATLAGYALVPGQNYRLRIYYPSKSTDEWEIKTNIIPSTLRLEERGDSTADFHELHISIPVWPENFIKSLKIGAADLSLVIEFTTEDRPAIPITIPLRLKPSRLALLAVLFPILLSFLNVFRQPSEKLANYISEATGFEIIPFWASIAFSTTLGLTLLVIYLWWKDKRQPAIRSRNHLQDFQKRLTTQTR
jgi:hypothetical protein